MYSSIDIACIEQPHINEGFLMETMRSSSIVMYTSCFMVVTHQMNDVDEADGEIRDRYVSGARSGTVRDNRSSWAGCLRSGCAALDVVLSCKCVELLGGMLGPGLQGDGMRKLCGVAARRKQLCS